MKIPFIKYVEALVACKLPIDTIYERIKQLNVPLSDVFDKAAIAQVYKALAKMQPDYFRTQDTLPDIEWLRKLNIVKMVAYELKLPIIETTIGIEGAFDILKDSNMYEIITSLALVKVDDLDLELLISGKYNIHYTFEDIKAFLLYFFNVENWPLSLKKEYVDIVPASKTKTYYKLALDGDKDYLIWKLGIAPDKSLEEMLTGMAMDSFYHFKEKQRTNPDEAQKWGTLLLKVSEKIDGIKKDEEEKKDLFSYVVFALEGGDPEEGEPFFNNKGKYVKSKRKGFKHINDLKKEQDDEL